MGAESGLYFTSGRRPLSGIIFAYPMLAGPLAGKLSRRLLDDLERSRPDLIVVNDQTFAFAQTQGQHPALSWLKENYRPFSKVNMFLLLARKGSRLDGRKPPQEKETGKSLPIAGSF